MKDFIYRSERNDPHANIFKGNSHKPTFLDLKTTPSLWEYEKGSEGRGDFVEGDIFGDN